MSDSGFKSKAVWFPVTRINDIIQSFWVFCLQTVSYAVSCVFVFGFKVSKDKMQTDMPHAKLNFTCH